MNGGVFLRFLVVLGLGAEDGIDQLHWNRAVALGEASVLLMGGVGVGGVCAFDDTQDTSIKSRL